MRSRGAVTRARRSGSPRLRPVGEQIPRQGSILRSEDCRPHTGSSWLLGTKGDGRRHSAISGKRDTGTAARSPSGGVASRCDAHVERCSFGAVAIVANRPDFYQPSHGHIFGAMRTLLERGEPIDAVIVAGELQRMGLEISDPSVFITLQANTPSVAHTRHYANTVAELAQHRKMIGIGHDLIEAGYEATLRRRITARRVDGVVQTTSRTGRLVTAPRS